MSSRARENWQRCVEQNLLRLIVYTLSLDAGLQITPNASKIFQHFDIYNALEPKAAEPSFLQVRRYSNGKILSRTDDFNGEMRRKYSVRHDL